MTKIALITIHGANSYGGCLQTLASQYFLSKFGDVSIIDYQTNFLSDTSNIIRFSGGIRAPLRMAKDCTRFFPRMRLLKKFENFRERNFKRTKYIASGDIVALKKLIDSFDNFVCGSDQIWNPAVTGGLDLSYFLDFAAGKNRFSLSSSAGSHVFTDAEKPLIIKNLQQFKAISCREKDTAERISAALGGRNVEYLVDPTLLLNKEQWINKLGLGKSKPPKGEYIFVYTLKKDHLVKSVIAKVRDKLRLPVVAIDQDSFLGYPTDQHFQDSDPVDYLNLILGAKFVITNSFHGTAFSVNFGIPFITTKPETGKNRIIGLLQGVGLLSRYLEDDSILDSVLECRVDFTQGMQYLASEEKRATEYVARAIE